MDEAIERRPPRWAEVLGRINQHMMFDLGGGASALQARDHHQHSKGGHLPRNRVDDVVLRGQNAGRDFQRLPGSTLRCMGRTGSPGSSKTSRFPTPTGNTARRSRAASAGRSFLPRTGLAGWVIISGLSTQNYPLPHNAWFTLCVSLCILGCVIMIAADVQKYTTLKLKRGLITTGMFKYVRHPNYLGEMMIYGSFALLAWHWVPAIVLAYFWGVLFSTNIGQERSQHEPLSGVGRLQGALLVARPLRVLITARPARAGFSGIVARCNHRRLRTRLRAGATQAQGYSQIAPRMMEPFAKALLERLEVDSTMNALEVAAGTGALTVSLAPRVASLVATDFAPKMVDFLKSRVSELGHSHVTCEVMDGQALAVEDASFDRAACMFGLMLFPDRAKGFAELRRALRPGGRAAVSGWAGAEEFDAFAIFLRALQTAFPDMPPPPGPPAVFSLADPNRFAEEMRAAGFAEVRVEKEARVVEVESVDDLWGMLTCGAPPVQILLDRVGPAGQGRLRDAIAGAVEERFGGDPIRLSNTATIGSGVAG